MQPSAVLPNALPPSRAVYVLTTSEGRDKVFKLLQYFLLMFVKVLQDDNLLPYQKGSRAAWVNSFTSNLSTIRFGRCLFRLGRWMITIVYLQMSLKFLALLLKERSKHQTSDSCSEKSSGGSAAGAAARGAPGRLQILLAGLLIVRSCASVCRSFIRDVLFLSDTGFAQFMRLSPGWHGLLERVQQLLWVTTSVVDALLIEYRLSLRGWVPDLRSLRCACDPAQTLPLPGGNSRFQFTPLDLDFGCPHPLVPSFFTALAPADMPIACRVCNQLAVNVNSSAQLAVSSSNQQSSISATAVCDSSSSSSSNNNSTLFLPNLVRRGFEYLTVLSAHENFRMMMALRAKAFCELVLSLALATQTFRHFNAVDVAAGQLPYVAWTTINCGIISACVSLQRVWLAAK